MRDDYASFTAQGAEIVVVSRHDADAMQAYWRKHKLPFPGISDPQGKITERFGQQWKLFSLGRMPAQVIVDCQGKVELAHYGKGMSDIIPNERVVEKLRAIRNAGACPEVPPT
jgi:peroxiredoxin